MDPAEAYRRLSAALDVRGWWPAESRFEVMVGAILTQRTSWTGAEGALKGLRDAGLLESGPLAAAPGGIVEAVVRPSGFYRQKAARIRGMARHVHVDWGGDLDRFFDRPPENVRTELLTWDGIGPETADAILLFAGGVPTFVVDAYTRRFAARVWSLDETGHEETKAFFEASLPRDAATLQAYHGLIVELGKRICRPEPRCSQCPLRDACQFHRKALKLMTDGRGDDGG